MGLQDDGAPGDTGRAPTASATVLHIFMSILIIPVTCTSEPPTLWKRHRGSERFYNSPTPGGFSQGRWRHSPFHFVISVWQDISGKHVRLQVPGGTLRDLPGGRGGGHLWTESNVRNMYFNKSPSQRGRPLASSATATVSRFFISCHLSTSLLIGFIPQVLPQGITLSQRLCP